MLTNKNVVDVVNKAIDDGEIQVGGLPEIESGDAGKVLKVNEQEDGVEWGEGGTDNALVLPTEAPASQQLVGINTSNEQNSLGIGDGLEIDNGVLKSKVKIFDFNNADTLSISNQEYANIFTNRIYDMIIIKNTSTKYRQGIFYFNPGVGYYVCNFPGPGYSGSTQTGLGFSALTLPVTYLQSQGTEDNYSLKFTNSGIKVIYNFEMPATVSDLNSNGEVLTTGANSLGTLGFNVMNATKAKMYERIFLRDGTNEYIWLHSQYYDASTYTLYLYGETATNTYACALVK